MNNHSMNISKHEKRSPESFHPATNLLINKQNGQGSEGLKGPQPCIAFQAMPRAFTPPTTNKSIFHLCFCFIKQNIMNCVSYRKIQPKTGMSEANEEKYPDIRKNNSTTNDKNIIKRWNSNEYDIYSPGQRNLASQLLTSKSPEKFGQGSRGAQLLTSKATKSPEKFGAKHASELEVDKLRLSNPNYYEHDIHRNNVVRVDRQHSMESQIDSVDRHIYSRNVNKLSQVIPEDNTRLTSNIPDTKHSLGRPTEVQQFGVRVKRPEIHKESNSDLLVRLPNNKNKGNHSNHRNVIIYKNGIKRSYKDNNGMINDVGRSLESFSVASKACGGKLSEKKISTYIRNSGYSNISHSYRQHNMSQKMDSGNNTPDGNSKSSNGKLKSEAESIDIAYDITTYIRCLFHDFRGPLNNISMGIDVLSQMISNIHHPEIAECNDMINNIHSSCEFMSSTLDGFLNLSQISDMNDVKQLKLTYTPFNIIGLIKKVQYLLMFNILEKKITIENKMSSELEVWVSGDATHLQHVFYNILSNAVKFSKKNSKIIINLDTEKIFGNTQKMIISFIDENEPLPAHIKENIFNLYNTSNTSTGTGLGLFICKKIIDLHNGKLYHEYTTNNLHSPNSTTKSNKFIIELELTICNNSRNNTCLSNDSSVKNNDELQLSSLNNNDDEQYYEIISFNGKQKLEQESNVDSIIDGVAEIIGSIISVTDNKHIVTSTSNNSGLRPPLLGSFIPTSSTGNIPNHMNSGERSSEKFRRNEGFAEPQLEGLSSPLTRISFGNPTNDRNVVEDNSKTSKNNTDRCRIAIVDDSEISRKLLNRLLLGNNFIKEHKCKIYEAIDGLDAISMLHNKIHNFSIIFMDNIMPSISGILASKILRGFGYTNLIFGITGNGLVEDINEFIDNGADYVFVKPFKKEKLDMIFTFVNTYGISIPSNKKMVESEDKTKFILVDY